MKSSSFLSLMTACMALGSYVHAEGDTKEIKVPRKQAWLDQVDLSSVPDNPVRPAGSGICENVDCNGPENDRCFETCGNTPTPEDIYGCPKENTWALTFDDGPSEFTDELLDILASYNVTATFCVMGAQVVKYPDVVKRAYEAGHQIASHTYSHPHLMGLTNEEIIYEIKATEEAIVDAIGVRPKYVRPPFGEADLRVKALLKSMGYRVLLWNVDPTDYNVYMKPNVNKLIRSAFTSAATGMDTGLNPHEDPGFISLQHDLYNQSIAQVPHIIRYLKKRGFSFTTAAECLGDKEPHASIDDDDEIFQAAVADGDTHISSSSTSSSTTNTGNSSPGTDSPTESAIDDNKNSYKSSEETSSSSVITVKANSFFGLIAMVAVAMFFYPVL
ncbi:hypothetical protein BX666DRAFT_1994007 [Dichotomocladium elegans]|nr:hypothetical protein BX666DRAFT_1994007 [Dichotomocladium elegans]